MAWSGGAEVLGKLPVLGRPTDLDYIRGVVGWCDGAGKLPVPGRPTVWIQ